MNDVSDTSRYGEKEGIDDYVFDFDKWLTNNNLTNIKQVFIDHNMNTLESLNFNNKHFVKLTSDDRISMTPHLTSNIISSIQSLQTIRDDESTKTKLVFVSPKENEIFTQIKNYLINTQNLSDKLKNIKLEYINKKNENEHLIKSYKERYEDRIDQQKIKIFNHLRNILNEKEEMITNKINKYKNELNEINIKHDVETKRLDSTLKLLESTINDNEKYLKEQIISYKNIIKKHNNTDNDINYDLTEPNVQRQSEITKLGQDTKTYHNKRENDINEYINDITKFINDYPDLFCDQKPMYSLQVNESIYHDICQDINTFMIVSDNEECEHQTKLSKSEEISNLKEFYSSNVAMLNNELLASKEVINRYASELSQSIAENEKLYKEIDELHEILEVKESGTVSLQNNDVDDEEQKDEYNGIYSFCQVFDDNYYDESKWKLSDDHKSIKAINRYDHGRFPVYCGDNGYNKGIHYVAIKYVDGAEDNALCSIGVTSERRRESVSISFDSWPKDGAYSCFEGDDDDLYPYNAGYDDDKLCTYSYSHFRGDCDEPFWSKSSTIIIKLDLYNFIVYYYKTTEVDALISLFKREIKLIKKEHLKRNKTYYFMLCGDAHYVHSQQFSIVPCGKV